MKRPLKRRSTLVVSILVVLSLTSFAAAQSYSVLTIGNGSPRAIDSNGNVAGVYAAPVKSRPLHAFLWTKSTKLQDLGTLGGSDSSALGLNAAGQVVGQADSSTAPNQASLWTKSAGMISLGTLGGPTSVANAINASGQVAGQSDLGTGPAVAFLWTKTGGLQNLGSLPGNQGSGANAINTAGEIAGWAANGTNVDAITWTKTTGIVDLGIAAVCGSTATGINDSNEVVGYFDNFDTVANCGSTAHSFSWTKSGGLKDLGTTLGQASFAYGVNSTGQIVGKEGTTSATSAALLWTADGVAHQLNSLISPKVMRKLLSANAINNAGQIVADATDTTGKSTYAVILTPIMNTTLVSSHPTSILGEAVVFSATVTSIAGPPPNGELVVFKEGALVLGSVPLNNGVAAVTATALTVGKHTITATYGGDAIYGLSKSSLLQTVIK